MHKPKEKFTIKIYGAGSVRVDFLDHNIKFLVRQLVVEFSQDLTQTRSRDVAVSCEEMCCTLRRSVFPISSSNLIVIE